MNLRAEVRRAAPWVLCAVSLTLCALAPCLWWVLRDQQAAGQVDSLDATIAALGFAGTPVVGALIASRRIADPYGWLWCTAGLVFGVANVARPLVRVVGGPLWVAALMESWGAVGLTGLLTFVFFLFPDGRLPSARWRWVAGATVTDVLLLLVLETFAPNPTQPTEGTPWALEGATGLLLGQVVRAGSFVLFCFALAALASLVLRYRRADPLERKQLAWFLYAAALNAVLLAFTVLGVVPQGTLTVAVYSVGFGLFPLAVGVAVLRYRLYEIDRIVSRTVSYGLLTAGLLGLYLLVVALLRPLLQPLTGSSSLAVAASTLAVAGAFNPARRRLQAVVDRRFDRARYDAAQAVAAFAGQLRNQVDLDEITASLRATVAATVAPGRVGVWLRTPGRPRSTEQ